MPAFVRDDPTELRPIDRRDGGVGWLAHPDEPGRRASHAVAGDDRVERSSTGSRTASGDGVWLFDPLDAPGVDDLVADVGEVAGVAVLSNYHARDAGSIAARHGVPVHVPAWLDRAEARVDAPVERFAGRLPGSGFSVRRVSPFPGWVEGVAYRESDGTLYVPDVLGTSPLYTVGEERLGVYVLCRPFPPREPFADLDPERILVGHGTGVFEDAGAALADALAGARRRFPAALVRNGPGQLRTLAEALVG